jgi:chromosome partitioning protein
MARRRVGLIGPEPRGHAVFSGFLGQDAENLPMRVVSIVNQKGGCGKTTTAVNLAAVLARGGARVLLVDMDPQSHCAAGLGVPEQTLERTVADAMLFDHAQLPRAADFVWEVSHGLRLLPSSFSLASLETPHGPMASRFDRDRRLARVLAAWRDDFDWCIIDCAPTLGLLTANALRASDLAIIPVETGFFSLKGAERQVDAIQAIVRRFGREIRFHLLPTLYNEARPLSRDVVAALEKRFPEALLGLTVREHEELRDAASYGQSVTEFAPDSEAVRDFEQLAAWLCANPPEATALDAISLPRTPLVETLDPRAFLERAMMPEGAVSEPEPDVSPEIPNPDAAVSRIGRAADLAARLRSLGERTRQSAALGGGYGVRVGRDGFAHFVQPASARALFVTGEFNGWSPVATPLAASADGLRMEARVRLPAGRHAYRIVTDGLAAADEFNPHRADGPDGLGLSLIEVPAMVAETASHGEIAR